MDLKDFFKPELNKLVITAVFAAIVVVSGLYLLNLPKECSDNADLPECQIPPLGYLLMPLYFIPLFLASIPSMFFSNTITLALFLILLIPITISYWYFLSCVIIFIYKFIKNR